MKRSILFVTSVLAVATLVAAGSTLQSLLFENFEDISPPDLPPGWTTLNANGDLGIWETRSYGGVKWGRQCIRYIADPTSPGPADDWFFTSGVDLETGENYVLRFQYCCTQAITPEAMSVFLGTGQTPDSMTIGIWSNPSISNTDFVEASVSFSVLSTATYYIGFHAESPPYSARLKVDDINLLREDPYLLLRLVPLKAIKGEPLTYQPDDSIQVMVYLENEGTDTYVINQRFAVGRWPSATEIEFVAIHDASGTQLPCINMYDKLLGVRSEDFGDLDPGEVAGKTVTLWNWLKFDSLGTHSIWAHYRNYADPGYLGAWKGEAISDTISIVIE